MERNWNDWLTGYWTLFCHCYKLNYNLDHNLGYNLGINLGYNFVINLGYNNYWLVKTGGGTDRQTEKEIKKERKKEGKKERKWERARILFA